MHLQTKPWLIIDLTSNAPPAKQNQGGRESFVRGGEHFKFAQVEHKTGEEEKGAPGRVDGGGGQNAGQSNGQRAALLRGHVGEHGGRGSGVARSHGR